MHDIAPGIKPALGIPALVIKKDATLVVGDLHIGLETKYSRGGIHFGNSSIRMGAEIKKSCEKHKCRSIVFLGDIKESIGFPDKEEYAELMYFFAQLRDYNILIAKGNHDGHGNEILKRIGIDSTIEAEIFVGGNALFHGNSWPTEEAMQAKNIICGHGHFAINRDSVKEKVFVRAGIGENAGKFYNSFNKNARMILVPAFSSLITGTEIGKSPPRGVPALKNNVFDWVNADIFGVDGSVYGKVRNLK